MNPALQLGYISVGWDVIEARGASNITIEGFTVRRSNDDGIDVGTRGLRNWTIANCEVRDSWKQGIEIHGVAYAKIRDNIATNNFSHGIYLTDSVTNSTLLRNTCAYNDDLAVARGGANGIRLLDRGSSIAPYTHDDTLEANVAYRNEDTGIEIRANGTLSRYNRSWSNQDHGYDHLYCVGVTHVGDLAWGNGRDGMSFETGSSQHTLRNCVIANNGRDRRRFDWEIETYAPAQAGWSSDNNVIWRAMADEPADSILINWKGGPQDPNIGNAQCNKPDSCFGTVQRFADTYGYEVRSPKIGAPTFVDSANGDFRPLATSAVIDSADTTVTGWLPRDVRGFVRHDYAGVPNGGYPIGTFRDIGPYEFDVAPGAPTIAVDWGFQEIAVSWTARGDDEDVGTAGKYEVIANGVVKASGTPAAPGSLECVFVSGLVTCSPHSVKVRMTDVDNGQTSESKTVSGSTSCAPAYASCGVLMRPGGGRKAAGMAGEEDYPLALERPQPSPARGVSTVTWSIPRGQGGATYELGLFDVAGRRVSTLEQGTAKAGRFSRAIAFRADHGAPLNSGVYFLRFRIGPQVLSRTVVLTR